tara:strand:- start:1982 stop:5554 length:3573 start_codon:yes stop_codon:yes gene_type:complete
MPEETLKYRVELDASDLSSQLEQLRGQIDAAVGAQADLATAGSLPSASNLLQMGGIAPAGDFAAGPGAGMSAMSGSFAPLGADAGGFTQQTNQFMQSLGQTLDQAAERTRLGFSKFNEDFRRIGLLQSPDYPEFGSSFAPPIDEQSVRGRGFFRSIGGAMGFGYDPMSTMSPGAYMRASEQTAMDGAGGFLMDNKFAIAGSAIGLAFGPGGAAVGGLIGTGVDMAEDLILADVRQVNQMSLGLRAMGSEQGLGISRTQSENMARAMLDETRSLRGIMEGRTLEEMQGNLAVFAEAGGFSQTGSAQEFETKVQQVLENTRQVAHSLGVFQDEAVRIMAELESKGIAGPGQMPGLAGQMGVLGGLSGMSAVDMIGFGVQSSEMFTGTGIRADDAFNIAIQSRVSAANLSYGDDFQREAVRQAGGANAAGMTIMEQSVRHMMSGQGMLQVANILGGGEIVEGNINQQLAGGINYLQSDPSNFFRMLAVQGDVVGQMGPMAQQTQFMSSMISQAEALGVGTDTASLTGFISQTQGMSIADARLMVENAAAGPEATMAANIMGSLNAVQQTQDEQTYGLAGTLRMGGAALKQGLKVAAVSALTGGLYYPVKSGLEYIDRNFGEFIQDRVEDVGDFFNDRERTRYASIEDEDLRNRVRGFDDDPVNQAMMSTLYTESGELTDEALANIESMAMDELNDSMSLRIGDILGPATAGGIIQGAPGFATGAAYGYFRHLSRQGRLNTRLSEENKMGLAIRSRGMNRDSRLELLDRYVDLQADGASSEQIEADLDVHSRLHQAGYNDFSRQDSISADEELQANLSGTLISDVERVMSDGAIGMGDFYDTIAQSIYGKNLADLSDRQILAVNRHVEGSVRLSELAEKSNAHVDRSLMETEGAGASGKASIYNIIAANYDNMVDTAMGGGFADTVRHNVKTRLKGQGGFSDDRGAFETQVDEAYDAVVDDVFGEGKDIDEHISYLSDEDNKQNAFMNFFTGHNERMDQERTLAIDLKREMRATIVEEIELPDGTIQQISAFDAHKQARAADIRGEISTEVQRKLKGFRAAGATDEELAQMEDVLTGQITEQRLAGEDFIMMSGEAFVSSGAMSREQLNDLRDKGLGTEAFQEAYLVADKIERSEIQTTLQATAEGRKQLSALEAGDTTDAHIKKQTNLLQTLANAVQPSGYDGQPSIRVFGNT